MHSGPGPPVVHDASLPARPRPCPGECASAFVALEEVTCRGCEHVGCDWPCLLPFDSARGRNHWPTDSSMSNEAQLEIGREKDDERWLGPISRGFRPYSRQRRRVLIRYNRLTASRFGTGPHESVSDLGWPMLLVGSNFPLTERCQSMARPQPCHADGLYRRYVPALSSLILSFPAAAPLLRPVPQTG